MNTPENLKYTEAHEWVRQEADGTGTVGITEHALARRIFVPEEYLDQTRDPHAGIPPRAEITVALDLDTGDLNAAGFRLDLIAAPTPPNP